MPNIRHIPSSQYDSIFPVTNIFPIWCNSYCQPIYRIIMATIMSVNKTWHTRTRSSERLVVCVDKKCLLVQIWRITPDGNNSLAEEKISLEHFVLLPFSVPHTGLPDKNMVAARASALKRRGFISNIPGFEQKCVLLRDSQLFSIVIFCIIAFVAFVVCCISLFVSCWLKSSSMWVFPVHSAYSTSWETKIAKGHF